MCHSGQESRQAARSALRGDPTPRPPEGHRGGGWLVPRHAPPRTSFHSARRRHALPPASHRFSSSAPQAAKCTASHPAAPPRCARASLHAGGASPTIAAERQERASGESLVKRSRWVDSVAASRLLRPFGAVASLQSISAPASRLDCAAAYGCYWCQGLSSLWLVQLRRSSSLPRLRCGNP